MVRGEGLPDLKEALKPSQWFRCCPSVKWEALATGLQEAKLFVFILMRLRAW